MTSKTSKQKVAQSAKTKGKSAKPAAKKASKSKAPDQKKTAKKQTKTVNSKRGKRVMSDQDKGKDQDKADKQALSDLATDNSLETVRDILFGAQVKQANERDQQLEKLINTRADSLQKSLDNQMKSVEATIQKLEQKLAKEASQTAASVEQRFKQVEEAIKNLDQQSQASLQEAYDELVADRQALESSAQTWNEDLAKELENVHFQLKESKTDRLTLANLLTDMAASLIADPKPQTKK